MIGFGSNNGASTGGNVGDADKLAKFGNTGKINPSAIPSVLITKWVKTTNQSVPLATPTTINFDSAQRNDLAITPSLGIFTLNKTGRYLIAYSIKATVTYTGAGVYSFTTDLLLNGTSSGILSGRENNTYSASGSQDPFHCPSTTYFFTSGDTIRLSAFQAGGSGANALGVTLPNIFTSLTIAYLGE
jgi:hypothetical protein